MDRNNSSTMTPNSSSSSPRLGIVLVLLIVLLGLGAYLVLKPEPANQPSTVASSQPQAQISITGTGFSPATISIQAGTQVTWTNDDAKSHQIAADPYPKNDSIPGLDSTQILEPGDSYGFSFETAGSYRYHDQLNPLELLGTVVVE